MKKIFVLLVFVCIQLIVRAQSFKEMEFIFVGKDRPTAERIFRASDSSHTMIYYSNATVSFFNGKKYTDMYMVRNIEDPERMIFVKSDGKIGTILYFVKENAGYINKATGIEYKLIQSSVKRIIYK